MVVPLRTQIVLMVLAMVLGACMGAAAAVGWNLVRWCSHEWFKPVDTILILELATDGETECWQVRDGTES